VGPEKEKIICRTKKEADAEGLRHLSFSQKKNFQMNPRDVGDQLGKNTQSTVSARWLLRGTRAFVGSQRHSGPTDERKAGSQTAHVPEDSASQLKQPLLENMIEAKEGIPPLGERKSRKTLSVGEKSNALAHLKK